MLRFRKHSDIRTATTEGDASPTYVVQRGFIGGYCLGMGFNAVSLTVHNRRGRVGTWDKVTPSKPPVSESKDGGKAPESKLVGTPEGFVDEDIDDVSAIFDGRDENREGLGSLEDMVLLGCDIDCS